MKKITNPVTGQTEYQFEGKLLRELSETTLQNSNGKNYKIATIEFTDVNGVIQKASAMIYEGNYSKGVTVGKEYVCTARKGADNQVYIQMSHLEANADRATTDMFDSFEEEAAPVRATSRATNLIES